MNSEIDLYVLSQINTGLRSDLQQLQDLDQKLRNLLQDIRTFHGEPSEEITREWDQLVSDLDSIHHYIQQVENALATESDNPRQEWQRIKEIDLRLEVEFTRLRNAGVTSLAADHLQLWSDLWRTVFLHLDMIRAHAAVIQAKCEMRARYGKAEADGMTEEVLRHLPADAGVGEAQRYSEEYRKAFAEYQQNKEGFGGFFDIVKSLLLVPEEDPDLIARRRMHAPPKE